MSISFFFFFNDPAPTEIYTLSLPAALPICDEIARGHDLARLQMHAHDFHARGYRAVPRAVERRSEEHTSELQSQSNLVCRLLLEKKKEKPILVPPPVLGRPGTLQQPRCPQR